MSRMRFYMLWFVLLIQAELSFTHSSTLMRTTTCRSLAIERTFSEGDDDVVWTVPAYVPFLNLREGGSLTMSNFTIWAAADDCGSWHPRRQWFYQNHSMEVAVFGGILPRAFMVGKSTSVPQEYNFPAAITLQSMCVKFER